MTDDDIWNHNLQYQQVLLDAIPDGCRAALDVGCGQGFLLKHLAARATTVIGIDQHAPSLAEAAERTAGLPNVQLVEADVMTHDLGQTFDAVLSIAVVHHLPLEPGLVRMRELTAPGGVLGVVGLARSTSLRDYARDGVGAVETRLRRLRRRRSSHDRYAAFITPLRAAGMLSLNPDPLAVPPTARSLPGGAPGPPRPALRSFIKRDRPGAFRLPGS